LISFFPAIASWVFTATGYPDFIDHPAKPAVVDANEFDWHVTVSRLTGATHVAELIGEQLARISRQPEIQPFVPTERTKV
jgi:hypothetical protein